MSLRFLLSVLFMLGFLFLEAQDLPKYAVDLDNEMHYKINSKDWQNRGIKEFIVDVELLFNKVDIVTNNKSIGVFFEIEFNDFGKPKLGLLGGTKDLERVVNFNNFRRNLSKIVKHFKPARYHGKIIPKTYLIKFSIGKKNNTASIYKPEFEPTLNFDREQLGCFTFYNKARGIVPSGEIYHLANILPEYNGGTNFLCFNMNRKLKTNGVTTLKHSKVMRDSLDIPFIVSRGGKLGMNETIFKSLSTFDIEILNLIKYFACDWKPALQSGRSLYYCFRMRFIFDYKIDKDSQVKTLIQISKIKDLRALESDFSDLRN